MVTMTATVDGAASRAFEAALAMWRDSLGEVASTAPRRAALALCKHFAASTRVAKQEKGAVFAKADESPKKITYRDGRKLDKPLRRWVVSLTDPERERRILAFARDDGRASTVAELRRMYATNYYPIGGKGSPQRSGGARGLAKRSWGWCAYNIWHGKAADTPWQRRKRDRRDPKEACRDSCSSVSSGVAQSGGMARICNRLDYIGSALKLSVQGVLDKATSGIVQRLVKPRLRASGALTAAEVRREARRIAHEYRAMFQS